MTDKTPAMPELPEPELGYIETDKSKQPAFSARQMRAALQSAQPAAAEFNGWYCAHCQRGVDASEVTYHEQHTMCGRVITNDVPPASQPAAAVSDESAYNLIDRFLRNNLHDDDYAEYSQALDILALRPQAVPMPEPVKRLSRYAGQTMRTARNPNITAREAIEIGDYLAAIGITQRADGGEKQA